MDRCAVFVDAGYLHAAATMLLTNSRSRRTLRTDQAGMLKAIRVLAEEETGLPLLRIYWYDAARNRVPDPEQRALANLPDLKLRLGNLRRHDDGKWAQKGVDADLHADMTELARNHGASDFVLISGDEDLLRAVDEAQTFGIRLHLWGVDGAGEQNQSLELIGAADRKQTLDAGFLRRFFEVVPDAAEASAGIAVVVAARNGTTGAPVANQAPVGDPDSPNANRLPLVAAAAKTTGGPTTVGVDGSSEELEANGPARPTPAVIAAQGPRPTTDTPPPTSEPVYSSGPERTGYVRAPSEREYLRLSELTTRAEQYKDREEDSASSSVDPFELGRTYATRWRLRATPFALAGVIASAPSIPRAIDAELLTYAERRGANTWGPEEVKFAVREGFWSALRN